MPLLPPVKKQKEKEATMVRVKNNEHLGWKKKSARTVTFPINSLHSHYTLFVGHQAKQLLCLSALKETQRQAPLQSHERIDWEMKSAYYWQELFETEGFFNTYAK